MNDDGSLIDKVSVKLEQLCDDPSLDETSQIRKKWIFYWMLTACSGVLFMTFLTVIFKVWPLFYYGIFLLLSYVVVIPLVIKSNRFDFITHLFNIEVVIATCIVMISLGGITTSHGLIVVGLNCAMASVLGDKKKRTFWLFQLYGITIIVAGAYELMTDVPQYINPTTNVIFYILNILWINATTLFLVFYYMVTKSTFEKLESERLRALDEVKTNLYTDITHEFRTPLTVILGMAREIKENPSKWMDKGIQAITNNGNKLLQLVNQILDLSKLKSGMISVELIPGDAIQYLEYLTESFQGLAESKGLTLQFFSDRESLILEYDEEKWMHIFSNIISNAIKYTSHGGSITVRVSAGKDLKVAISDTGIGIAPEDTDHIYDRYYRTDESKSRTDSGFGLGLALTKELVQLLEGSISVESCIGEGTTFTVTLPIPMVYNSEELTGSLKTVMKDHIEEGDVINVVDSLHEGDLPLLLIVEDNNDVIDYLQGLLEDKYIIIKAEDGRVGLEKATRYIPDIIISDVMMPDMDGYELVDHLRSDLNTNHIPIVLLTAKADKDSKITGLQKGANAYLYKPFDKEELFATLKQLLLLRKKLQEKHASLPLLTDKAGSYEVKFLKSIHELIDENLQNESHSITDIYKHMGMSRAQFYRKFKSITDQPIGKYLMNYRLHKAKSFLHAPEYNVTQAAMAAGFKNMSHFSTAFKNEFGYSPKEAQIDAHQKS
ncbi:MAG: response regulator [Saprospiraceae bacterium]|nr:response regulator [Saprospiraceae bacterium]